MPTGFFFPFSSIKPLPPPTFIQRLHSAAMAQEGSEASVASSSPAPNWWEMHANPVSSWNVINRWQQPHSDIISPTNCDDRQRDHISIPAADSRLSIDSSSADLSGEPTESHLWNQVLFAGRNGGDLHGSHDGGGGGGGSFLDGLPSKSLATEMFDPACDYLKKLDSSWDFGTNHLPVLDGLEKAQLNGYNGGTAAMIEPERMTNLSDLISSWSIAPPNPTCGGGVSLNPSMDHYSMPNLSQIKHEVSINAHPYPAMGYQGHLGSVPEPPLLRPLRGDGVGYQAFVGLNKYYCGGMADAPWSSSGRSLSDLISFGSSLSRPAMEFRAAKPSAKGTSEASDSTKKQGYETSSSTKGSGRSSGITSEGKKKRSQESSETPSKKSKHESSNESSLKLQAPKVKLGDRITALQQIVSPFGKTDTASVLLEAINYIRFLQEQVQLLSDPYMKSSPNKDHNSWGALERKDKIIDPKLDLKGRGLCLVPISCTPQIYRENTGPDYWTPTYRGCLYR